MTDSFQGHKDGVWSIAYSPDGKHIVSGSLDKTIRIWDISTYKTVAGPFQGHTDSVWSIAYSPDGKSIVSGSADGSLKVWKTQELFSLPSLFIDNGWIQSPTGDVFGWLAPWNRKFLWCPCHSVIISSCGICQANVDSSLFGELWISCWD